MPIKKIRLAIIIFCTALFNHAIAQDSILAKKTQHVFLSAAVFYDFPQSVGAIAGIDFPLKHITTLKTKKTGNTIEKNKVIIIGANVGFYRYKFNNTGLLLSSYLGTKYLYKNASYFELSSGIGLLHTFYDGIVYTVNDNGTVKEIKNYGRTYATVNTALAYGWDFSRIRKSKPFSLQIQPVFWLQFPYNSFVLLHGSLALSIKYQLPNFSVGVKQKEKHKTHQT
ncbi:hypothetical protein BH10BAC3_BH10BAC3_40530 [soil metagenome]